MSQQDANIGICSSSTSHGESKKIAERAHLIATALY